MQVNQQQLCSEVMRVVGLCHLMLETRVSLCVIAMLEGGLCPFVMPSHIEWQIALFCFNKDWKLSHVLTMPTWVYMRPS